MSDKIKSKIEEIKTLHEEAKKRFQERHQELLSNHKERVDSIRGNFQALREAHGVETPETKEINESSST